MFVFSNLAISLDGKIGTADRSITHLGSPADLKEMLALRKRADAILFGASTLRAYEKPCRAPGRRKQPINVEGRAEILCLTPGRAAAPQILKALAARGVKRLLIEGGGNVMWQFVERDLIDEYHVTLTPQLIGGTESPTLVDGAGFPANRLLKLKLARLRRVGDEIFLVYRKR
jgi:riboflavin biosynthesis pyrimidine reductase